MGDKGKNEGQRQMNRLTDTCTNTHDAGAMMKTTKPQSWITIFNVFFFCYADGLSKPLQQREMLVANHWLKISTELGCGWTSFPP